VAAAAWARLCLASHPEAADRPTADALKSLSQADKKDPSDMDYAFEKDDIRAWLEALRASPREEFPARRLVERKLVELLEEKISRPDAAAWAWPLVENDDRRVTDFAAWEALQSISMCDGKHPDGRYMYDKASFRSWLEQLRASPAGGR